MISRPLGSYYDFINRFWIDPRERYSRSALFPTGRNGKKPKKLIGADGKLAEPDDRRNNALKIELPLLIKFTDARRHDSKNFLYAIDDFGRNAFGISPKNICLDSAHDNIPTYELLDRWDINALIDINGRAKSSENAPADITFDKTGHPFCPAGHKMCPWGNDPIKDAHKYRCPLKCGRIDSCPHTRKCSPGKYGRTIYIKNHGDLQQLKIRGRDHFSFWTMLIGICIHLDARYKAAHLYTA